MNKNGWGLRVELVFILIFLICLAIATIGLSKMGLLDSFGTTEESEPVSYQALENTALSAAKKYVNEVYNNELTDETTYIRINTLYYNGYVTKLVDSYSNECSGYVKVIKSNNSLIYLPYIKCSFYKTDGYEGSNDW